MKVTSLNYSDYSGGAAKAAYRIHQAIRNYGMESTLHVNHASLGDWTVVGPKSDFAALRSKLFSGSGRFLSKSILGRDSSYSSLAVMPTRRSKALNASDADVIHLHWVNGEMMSIADIGKLEKPVVWTLHDMWAFCGIYHYVADDKWKASYIDSGQFIKGTRLNLDRWTWLRKKRHWKYPIHIVTPSKWLSQCVKESSLMCNFPVSVIPNPINTDVWRPIAKSVARELLGLPKNKLLILFGAVGGVEDPRKGFDLLLKALQIIRFQPGELDLVIFGQSSPKEALNVKYFTHYLGRIHDDLVMQLAYSAADVMVVPSRQEAFGQTASEALACGCPVVGFAATGLLDIVDHLVTGYLAEPFREDDLSHGIEWVLKECGQSSKLNLASRERAVALFRYPVIAGAYAKTYADAIKNQKALL